MDGSINFYILNRKNKVVSVLSTEEVGEHIPVLSATVEEKLSSYDILTLSIPADTEGSELLKEEYTIVFEDIKGWREYIITEIEDTDGDTVIKTVTAELSSVELLDDIVETELKGRKDPEDILRTILSGTRWNVGNVDTSIYNSSFNEMTQYKSVLEVIDLISSSFKCEVAFSYTVGQNNVANRFVHLYKQIGSDKGKRFEVDKDVTEITRTIDTTALKTAIIPFGAEPSEATEGEEQAKRLDIKNVVWSKAKGDPVDKPKGQSWLGDPQALANWGKAQEDGSLKHRFIALEINVDTEAELAAMAWVNLGKYTEPKVTYEAKVIDLYRTTGDEDLKHEHVFLGDTVAVLDNYFADPLLVKSRVIELVRDLLDPLNNEIVLGTAKQSFRVSDVEREVEDLATLVAKANYTASNAVINGSGSTTFSGTATPLKPVKGDSWFRPHPTKPGESQLVIYNGTMWEVAADTAELEAVKEEMQGALLSIETAKQSADSAVTKADQAIKDAGFAQTDAGTAKKNAADALSAVGTAISTANTAKTNASTALTTAQTSIVNADTALTNAEKALNKATATETETGRLTASYNELTKTVGLKAEKEEVSSIKGTVTNHSTDISANALAIGAKADKTTVDTINKTVESHSLSIKATADGLASKAEKSLVDSLNGTVTTHTGQIKANADGLAVKADKSLLDSINGTVKTHTTQIKATSDGLTLKADKTLVDTVKSVVDKHTLDIKVTADGLAAKAEKTLVDSLNKTVTSHTSEISANAQAINARLTSTQVDSLVSSKGYVNQAQLTATSDKWNLSLMQVSTDLSNLEIGGRNLLLESKKIEISPTTRYVTKRLSKPILPNQKYTISIGYREYVTEVVSHDSVLVSTRDDRGGTSTSIGNAVGTVFTVPIGGSVTNVFTNTSQVIDTILFYSADENLVSGNREFYFEIKVVEGEKDTGWTPAPEDMATLEQFTTIDATVKGLQTTVGNKADQSQVTQLANQWTQTTALVNGHTGQISNLGEQINLRVTSTQVTEAILSNKKIQDTRNDNQSPTWYFTNYPRQTVEEFKFGRVIGALPQIDASYGVLTTKVPWTETSGGAITQTFSTSSGVYQRKGSTAWGTWDKVAEAGKLISQINLSTEGVLIQGKNILLDGNVTMQDAFISKIKAIDITADRIKGGTINGSNVNVINLNANNITAGILKGTNLSLNLTTGEVLFQKGVLKRTDNKFGMDITRGVLESYSSSGGITLKDGSLQLYKNPQFIDVAGRADMYGSIDYEATLLSGYGLSISGTDGVILKTSGYVKNPIGGQATETGLIMYKNKMYVTSEGPVFLSGGMKVDSPFNLGGAPSVKIGIDYNNPTNIGKDVTLEGNRVEAYAKGGNKLSLSDDGLKFSVINSEKFMINGDFSKTNFRIGDAALEQFYDSAGAYMRSMTIYKRTTSAAANAYVSSNGTLARSTSASKYKLNISEIPNIEDYSAKILEIKPKQWFDKSSVESYAEEIEHKTKGRIDSAPITPFYGLIAEDLVEAGLEKYVQYGSDGKEVEGIMYDRLWTLLIPIVKQQKEDIAELKTKITEMENVI